MLQHSARALPLSFSKHFHIPSRESRQFRSIFRKFNMPIVVSNEGWVKIPPKPVKRSSKPADPVGMLRGPLAYITGRPDFKEPVKKQSISQLIRDNQLLLETAAPPIPPLIFEDRPRKHKSRVPSAPIPHKSKSKAPTEIFEEADEEILRLDLRPDDSASRRSASPIGSRRGGGAPSVRSRRHDDDEARHRSSRSKGHKASQSVYDLHEEEPVRAHRSRKHISSSHSVYSDDEPRHHYRSSRSERSYRDYGHSYSQSYAHPPMPQIQPIVIYSTPPPTNGCGGHHQSCQSHTYQQHQCYSQPQRMIETPIPVPTPVAVAAPITAAEPAALPAPARSEVSSRSSGSTTSRAMSYKWYTATQPLRM